jgi:hypothetical protein
MTNSKAEISSCYNQSIKLYVLEESMNLEQQILDKVIGKAIAVTGREGPWGFYTARLPYFV